MFQLKQKSLVVQIALAATVVSAAIFSALIACTTYLAEQAALVKTEEELHNQVKGVVRMLELSHGNAVAQAGKGLQRLHDSLGKLRVGPDTVSAGSYQVPVVKSGERIVNGNLALLDSLRQQVDAEPALLLRVGDELVRAATLLKGKDGKSAEGTALAPSSQEARALLAGQPYTGVVKRSGKYYISAIEPILDDSGKTIGALSARIDIQGDMERLFKALADIRSGSSGYAYVLAPAEALDKTELVYHPSFAGKLLGEVNNPALTRIVAEQLERKHGAMRYNWSRTPGGPETEPKMVVFETAPAWGWVVATGSFIEEFTVEARRLRNLLVALCAAGAVLLAVVLYLITRQRLAPIRALMEACGRLGQGDFSARFPATSPDSRNELDLITRSLETTTRQIGGLIGDVVQVARSVKEAARGVRLGSDEVLGSTSAQSESAAGMARAIEELAVSIQHVSHSAATARDMSQQAQHQADDGGAQMRRMIGSMERIAAEIDQAGSAVNLLSERSARISNIGRIIHEIADQTNLLALNAAIEAARAGESGRGFAVVADEVRKLAERTASSTREISSTVSEVQSEAERVVTMIEGVIGGVREGVQMAGDSGAVLENIRSESARSTIAVNDIADTTREQSATSQEVAHGVEDIARMAEQNKQISRRSHAQTERLEELASELEVKVGHFRI